MKAFLLASALLFLAARVVHAQVPPLTLLPTTTSSTTTTSTTPPVETTTTESLPDVSSDITIEPLPETALSTSLAPEGSSTTSIVTVSGKKAPRSSVASAITGAFAVAIATVFAVSGIFVSLSIRSRVRR